ncbi:co-regulatory protein PtrA N-terminal domain-containing protein [Pseudomonas sp. MYb118]|uniref:co-regulatory protein PtrA N-terminal domain-containing protein n=1 Tax=Pseudomonas sp. MYb118 TaxID=1848720 RepID=UPI0034CDE5A6
MKATKVLILTFSLAISSLAFAEGGGDRAAERMERARETAMSTLTPSSGTQPKEDVAQDKPVAEKPNHQC